MSIGNFGSKGAAAAKLAMLQRRISKKKMEVEEDGIKVVVTGAGKIKAMEIDGEDAKRVLKVVNNAIERAQKWAAGEMQGMMGDLGKLFK
ncbi:YbaB/EbfC family nucleoid-associated protein [Patescibacteria group bacterium]|nr:YbaB/EbfC family nucleoid-associated protein [Patescibacteria group bacterium]MBU1256848.1 YbaB/EbfC family nucleoid-associated protein [Patescibacteria group bacterium]MBU1457868.1 YbaB/EbfC family nucleoid-associated protein [Patescibacteria group bacterium]